MANRQNLHPLAALGTGAGLTPAPTVQRQTREISPELHSLIIRRIADPRTTAREFLSLADLAEREGAVATATALRARAAQKGTSLPSMPHTPPVPPAPTTSGDETELDLSMAVPVQPRPTPAPQRPSRAPGLTFRPRQTPHPAASAGDEAMPETPPAPKRDASSPIPGVPLPAWIDFEKLMARGKSMDVTAAGRLGMFGFTPKRLQDLGLVKEVRKVTVATPEALELLEKAKEAGPNDAAELRAKANMAAKRRWDAAVWAEGVSREKFLGSPDLQIRAFRKSMREYTQAIRELYKGAIGKQVGGKPVTLSGLLAVAHVCGAPGLDSWIKKADIREQFPQTTKAFMMATGLF